MHYNGTNCAGGRGIGESTSRTLRALGLSPLEPKVLDKRRGAQCSLSMVAAMRCPSMSFFTYVSSSDRISRFREVESQFRAAVALVFGWMNVISKRYFRVSTIRWAPYSTSRVAVRGSWMQCLKGDGIFSGYGKCGYVLVLDRCGPWPQSM